MQTLFHMNLRANWITEIQGEQNELVFWRTGQWFVVSGTMKTLEDARWKQISYGGAARHHTTTDINERLANIFID